MAPGGPAPGNRRCPGPALPPGRDGHRSPGRAIRGRTVHAAAAHAYVTGVRGDRGFSDQPGAGRADAGQGTGPARWFPAADAGLGRAAAPQPGSGACAWTTRTA